MGGAETTGAPVRRYLPDAPQAPLRVAVGALSDRSGGRIRGRGRDVISRGEGESDQGKERGRGGGTGYEKVGDSGGVGTDGIPGRSPCGIGGLASGGPETKGGGSILRHRSSGGGVEGGGGDSQFPLHRLHHLPRLPPWFPGRLWYRYHKL